MKFASSIWAKTATVTLVTFALSVTANAQDTAAPSDVAEAAEVKAESSEADAKPEKITDRSHPDYVRCRTERRMGSLAQRRKRCMTNREWKMVQTEGNKRANELVDEMRSTSVPNN